MIQIQEKTLLSIQSRLEAQQTLFNDPEFLSNIPLTKRPLMKLERHSLKKLLKEINTLLENGKL